MPTRSLRFDAIRCVHQGVGIASQFVAPGREPPEVDQWSDIGATGAWSSSGYSSVLFPDRQYVAGLQGQRTDADITS